MIESKLLKNPELSITLACVLGGVKQASFRRGMTFSSFPFNMYFLFFPQMRRLYLLLPFPSASLSSTLHSGSLQTAPRRLRTP